MGHTRWATHGAPTDRNAHPHLDCDGRVAVIHNGIVENFQALRARLEKAGHALASETDTECVAHLVEEKLRERPGASLADAVRAAVAELEGAYSLVVCAVDDPGTLVGVKVSSPLVVGLGEGETLLASDIPALLDRTTTVIPMDEGEVVEITRDGAAFTDLAGAPHAREPITVDWNVAQAQKSGFDDFMLKEIHEQPSAIRDTLVGRLIGGRLTLDELHVSDDVLREVNKVFVVACGTAFHSGLVAKYAIEHWTRLPVEIEIASEFRYRDPVLGPDTLTLAVSQIRRDHRHARGRTPRPPSGLPGDRGDQHRGLLARPRGRRRALHARRPRDRRRGHEDVRDPDGLAVPGGALPRTGPGLDVPRGDRRGARAHATRYPRRSSARSASTPRCARWPNRYAQAPTVLFIGRHTGYPAALEGALKLKEISYIHAEGFPAGELKHGPIALVEEGVPVVAIATQCHIYPKMLSNIQEVRARGAEVIAVATEGDTEAPGARGPRPRGARDAGAARARHGDGAAAALRVSRRQAPRVRRGPAAQPGQERHRRVGGRVAERLALSAAHPGGPERFRRHRGVPGGPRLGLRGAVVAGPARVARLAGTRRRRVPGPPGVRGATRLDRAPTFA